MSKFIYFTPEEKARAQNTDLVSLLRAQGERPVRSGREFRKMCIRDRRCTMPHGRNSRRAMISGASC